MFHDTLNHQSAQESVALVNDSSQGFFFTPEGRIKQVWRDDAWKFLLLCTRIILHSFPFLVAFVAFSIFEGWVYSTINFRRNHVSRIWIAWFAFFRICLNLNVRFLSLIKYKYVEKYFYIYFCNIFLDWRNLILKSSTKHLLKFCLRYQAIFKDISKN